MQLPLSPTGRIDAIRLALSAVSSATSRSSEAHAQRRLLLSLARYATSPALALLERNALAVAEDVTTVSRKLGFDVSGAGALVADELRAAGRLPERTAKALATNTVTTDADGGVSTRLRLSIAAALFAACNEPLFAAYAALALAQPSPPLPVETSGSQDDAEALGFRAIKLILLDNEWTRRLTVGLTDISDRAPTALLAGEIESELHDVVKAADLLRGFDAEVLGRQISNVPLPIQTCRGTATPADFRERRMSRMTTGIPTLHSIEQDEVKAIREKAMLVAEGRATPGDMSHRARCTIYAVAAVAGAATGNWWVTGVAMGAAAYDEC